MKLIIGLGNPGKEYENTRHNVGYLFIKKGEKLLSSKDFLFRKTNLFMNSSGDAVEKLISTYKVGEENLYLAFDDLDLPLGKFKIQFGVGPKDHKGLNSVYEKLQTHDFWHIRIGVDARNPLGRVKGEEYVLEDFTPQEKVVIDNVLAEICKRLVI